jgi:hypothetical protein
LLYPASQSLYAPAFPYFFGSGAGAFSEAGAAGLASVFSVVAGAVAAGFSLITVLARFVEEKARIKHVHMKTVAAAMVNLLKKPIAPALPKRVWLAPPKAAPISAPFPAWRRTIITSAMEARICRIVIAVIIGLKFPLSSGSPYPYQNPDTLYIIFFEI